MYIFSLLLSPCMVHRRTFSELIFSLMMVTVEKVKAISGDDDDDY